MMRRTIETILVLSLFAFLGVLLALGVSPMGV